MMDAVVIQPGVDTVEPSVSGVSWPAVAAGAVVSCALTLVLLAFGIGLGLSVVSPWSGGLMQVQGGAPDFASSYFLDRDLWRKLQERHPEGLVAAVPRRGGLVYAPASDTAALTKLRFSAAALFAGAHGTQVSSALYLFKDGHWSVFEPPQPR